MLFRICKSRYSTPRYEPEIDHIYVIFLCEITAVRKSVIFLILTIDSRKQLYHTLPINLNCPIIVYCTFISQYEIYSYDLLKKKKKERDLYKNSLDILRLDVYSIYTTPFVPFNVGKEARNRFEGDAKGFAMAQKFLSDIDFAEDPRTEPTSTPRLACVAF